MDSREVKSLMEAYVGVYASPNLEEDASFEEWVESLIDEGYDLSDYTWEEVYEAYLEEERAEGVKPYKPQPLKPLPKAKPLSGKKGDVGGYGDDTKFKQDTDAASFQPGKTVPKVKTFGRISRAMPPQISGHATKTISANTRTRGEDPGAPRSQKISKGAKTTKMVKRDGKWVKEAYDIVLAHLVDEGYADSVKAANAIMANMSEGWIYEIIETDS